MNPQRIRPVLLSETWGAIGRFAHAHRIPLAVATVALALGMILHAQLDLFVFGADGTFGADDLDHLISVASGGLIGGILLLIIKWQLDGSSKPKTASPVEINFPPPTDALGWQAFATNVVNRLDKVETDLAAEIEANAACREVLARVDAALPDIEKVRAILDTQPKRSHHSQVTPLS